MADPKNTNDGKVGNGARILNIQEAEPRRERNSPSAGGRAALLLASAIGASALAGCEYNYNYGSDQDAATNPDGTSCTDIRAPERCNDTIVPNSARCMVYEGAALELDGYKFRVGEVRSEGDSHLVHVDILATSLDCQPVGSGLDLVVGAADETNFMIGPFEYRARATSIFRESTDFPALVDLSVYKVSTDPVYACAEESDRCFYRDSDGVRCVAYEDRAVQFDDYLFIVTGVRDGTIVDIEVQDKELGCETIATFSIEADGEEQLYAPGTGSTYGIKARNATPGSAGIPASADLEVRRVSDEPTPSVCPETTDRCETIEHTAVFCIVYQDIAAELNGVLFTPRNIREEGGVKKLDVEVYDRELGCDVIETVPIIAEGTGGWFADVTVGAQRFSIGIMDIVVDGAESWASMVIRPVQTACDRTEVADRCATSSDSVRCMAYSGTGIQMDGFLLLIDGIEDDGTTRRISLTAYRSESGCPHMGSATISVPGTTTFRIGTNSYKVTVFGVDTSYSDAADIQVERVPSLCGGSEVTGIINLGELIDAGMGLKVRLDDISRDGEAMLTVLDTNDNEFMRLTLGEGEAQLMEYMGRSAIVSVNEVAAGVMLIEKWANLTVQACD